MKEKLSARSQSIQTNSDFSNEWKGFYVLICFSLYLVEIATDVKL
jgi:hypothetical protein